MNRYQRVEEISETDSMCLRHETEEPAVSVETPRAASSQHLQRWFPVTEENFRADTPGGILVNDLQHVRTVPLGIDKLGQSIRNDAFDKCASSEVFESSHCSADYCASWQRITDQNPGERTLHLKITW